MQVTGHLTRAWEEGDQRGATPSRLPLEIEADQAKGGAWWQGRGAGRGVDLIVYLAQPHPSQCSFQK